MMKLKAAGGRREAWRQVHSVPLRGGAVRVVPDRVKAPDRAGGRSSGRVGGVVRRGGRLGRGPCAGPLRQQCRHVHIRRARQAISAAWHELPWNGQAVPGPDPVDVSSDPGLSAMRSRRTRSRGGRSRCPAGRRRAPTCSKMTPRRAPSSGATAAGPPFGTGRRILLGGRGVVGRGRGTRP